MLWRRHWVKLASHALRPFRREGPGLGKRPSDRRRLAARPLRLKRGVQVALVNACVLYRRVHMDTRGDRASAAICGDWGCTPQQVVACSLGASKSAGKVQGAPKLPPGVLRSLNMFRSVEFAQAGGMVFASPEFFYFSREALFGRKLLAGLS